MEPELSRRLFHEGGFLVLLDVPKGTEVGIDYNSWNTGPKFRGIKMIPPGFHFIYFSAVSKEGHTAPRTGFFHFFQSKEVVIKRWDPTTESLTSKGIEDILIDRIKSNLQDLDPCLGPYPYDSLKRWASLSNHVTRPLLERIQPLNGEISSVTQVSSETKKDKQVTAMGVVDVAMVTDTNPDTVTHPNVPKEKKDLFFAGVGSFTVEDASTIVNEHTAHELSMAINTESVLRFSDIPSQKHPIGATPIEITIHNMDFSYALETFLENHYENDDTGLLGELQLSFVCFIVGQVYEAFEQWKKLVYLLCYSEQSLLKHVELYKGFVSVLHFQLKEVPQDFFVDIVSRNNFLTNTLQVFFSNISQCAGIDTSLAKKALQFRDNLTKHYQWDFTSEPDDNAPTVVDTDES